MKTLVHVIAWTSIGLLLATVVSSIPETTTANAPAVLNIEKRTADRAAYQATLLPSGDIRITDACPGEQVP